MSEKTSRARFLEAARLRRERERTMVEKLAKEAARAEGLETRCTRAERIARNVPLSIDPEAFLDSDKRALRLAAHYDALSKSPPDIHSARLIDMRDWALQKDSEQRAELFIHTCRAIAEAAAEVMGREWSSVGDYVADKLAAFEGKKP